MAAIVQIIINAVNNASKELKNIDSDSANLLATLGGLAAGAAGVKVVLTEAFQFGKEGAQVAQLEESFDRLMTSLGFGPDVLNEWSDAVGGTIPEAELMSSTLTLLAGAEEDVARGLAEATPQLLEVAKAANKLNPTLGDTAFLYESITRGIKRNSPLILDNLGIVVKVGEANENYAAAMGKTVEEMTAQERTLALLNATLDAGGTLIEQVGGNTESATDAFERMEAELTNLTNNIKASTAPTLARLVNGLNVYFEVLKGIEPVLAEHINDLGGATRNYAEYREEVIRSAQAAGFFVDESGGQIRVYKDMGMGARAYIDDLGILSESQHAAAAVTADLADKQRMMASHMDRATLAVEDQTEATRDLKGEFSDLELFIKGPLRDEYDKFEEDNEDLALKIEDLRGQIDELEKQEYLTAAQEQELEGLRTELGEAEDAVDELAATHDEATKRILFNLLSQRAAMDELTEAELALLNDIALEWGLVDQKTHEAVNSIDAALLVLAEGNIEEARAMVQGLSGDVDSIPSQVTIKAKFNSAEAERQMDRFRRKLMGFPSSTGGGSGSGSGDTGTDTTGQRGLDFFVPPGFPGDSFRVGVSSGERVIVQTPGQMERAGSMSPGNVYNFNIQGGPDVVEDLRVLTQAMALLNG